MATKMITGNQNFMKNMLLAMQQQNMQFLGKIAELFKHVKKKMIFVRLHCD